MSQILFESLQTLYEKLGLENLDIHQTKEELQQIVRTGRESNKLNIITQFLSIHEALSRHYEYEDAQILVAIKSLLKVSLALLLDMVHGTISYQDGAYQMEKLLKEARTLLVEKVGDTPFLYDQDLLYYMAQDLQKEIQNIKALFQGSIILTQNQHYYDTAVYHLKKSQDLLTFMGFQDGVLVIDALQSFLNREYQEPTFSNLGSNPDFLLSLEFLEDLASAVLKYHSDKELLIQEMSKSNSRRIVEILSKKSSLKKGNHGFMPPMVLTDAEMTALLSENDGASTVSFDSEEDHQHTVSKQEENASSIPDLVHIDPKEYKQLHPSQESPLERIDVPQEDILIKYLGRLFQKQEFLSSCLSEHQQIAMVEDLKEMNKLKSGIKKMLFDHYYITIERLLGQGIRSYIQETTQDQGKKIKLGIRGEKSEILTRESEFVKHIIFSFVKNALTHSIEYPYRRRALDKTETGMLLIEFEDTGNMLDISIRDDGRGLIPDLMNIIELEDQIINRGGQLSIDSVENEYLKIHIQLPMKKILTDCLVVLIGETYVLIPNRCISRVIDLKEMSVALRDEHCLGQINLSTLLGLNHSAIQMMVICEFGAKKIIFGVEKILYNIEALADQIDTPLIACSDEVAILNDGNIGFILNEKKLYQKGKELIEKRTPKITSSIL